MHETRIFVEQKFVKRAEKIIFSLVFVCFRFTEISNFLSFPSNEKVRKQYLSPNAYFCINMKFSHMIAQRWNFLCHVVTSCSELYCNFLLMFTSIFRWQYLSKKIKFSVALQGKQAIFQLFAEDIHIFLIIYFRKRDRRIVDRLFFLL